MNTTVPDPVAMDYFKLQHTLATSPASNFGAVGAVTFSLCVDARSSLDAS